MNVNSKQPTKFLVYITGPVKAPHIDNNTFATFEDKWHTCRHKKELLSLTNLTSNQLGYNNINLSKGCLDKKSSYEQISAQLDNCVAYARN